MMQFTASYSVHMIYLCLITCFKRILDPLNYYGYKRPGKRIKADDKIKYHITAKFLGRDPDPPYQSLAHGFLNKMFRIHLVGIVFTPRTLGVRIGLTSAQKLLFDEKDGKWNSSVDELTKKQVQDELDNYKFRDKLHRKLNPQCKMKATGNGISYKGVNTGKNHAPVTTTKSRAHITIACAANVLPKKTGDDLVDIIDLEQRPATRSANFQQDYPIKHYGTLRQFGRHPTAFVFYPNYEMIVPAQFSYYS